MGESEDLWPLAEPQIRNQIGYGRNGMGLDKR